MGASPYSRLTEFAGEPILVEFRPHLRAARGKLVSPESPGSDVHAASFLRQRRIILDSSLLRNRQECDRILAHEIFHFVWWKAPALRCEYTKLIRRELSSAVNGEMGWSADWRRQALAPADARTNSRRFREYLCESFCDTSACMLLGISRHAEITLRADPHRERREFFEAYVAGKILKI